MESDPGFTSIEQGLREAEFEDCRELWYSSNYVYLARLRSADGSLTTAVYKPGSGERPLWDFPPGLYEREVAAYEFSKLLRWPFIPPTIARDGPSGPGSVQLFVKHDPEEHFFVQREHVELAPQLQRIAAFDALVNNADRKGGHCLLDEHGKIWGIDHGLCFHEDDKLRTVIWDWADSEVDDDLLEDIARVAELVAAENEEARPLLEWLTRAERRALARRMARMLEHPHLPVPGPRRSYPWPLV